MHSGIFRLTRCLFSGQMGVRLSNIVRVPCTFIIPQYTFRHTPPTESSRGRCHSAIAGQSCEHLSRDTPALAVSVGTKIYK